MRYIGLTFFIIALFSCKKADLPDSEGKAEALMNGEKWEALVHAKYINDSKDSLYINLSSYNKNGFKREHLSFFIIPYHQGEFQLTQINYNNRQISACKLFLHYDDGDLVGDNYNLIYSYPDNKLIISDINYKRSKVEGTFEVMLEVDTSLPWGKVDSTKPDIYHFTDGKFSFKIEE